METEESGTEREKEEKEGKGATLRTPFMFMHLTLVLHLIFTTISHANNTAEPKNIAPGCPLPVLPDQERSCGGIRCAASFKRLTRCQYLKNVIFLHIKLKRIIVNQPLVVSD